MPPRPKEIRLDSIDPCALLTKAQSEQLKVDSAVAGTDTDTYKGAKLCQFGVSRRSPFYDYVALLVTTEGAESWLAGDRNVEAAQTTVGGYGAARFHFKGGSGTKSFECTTAVDVAPGQHLQLELYMTTRGVFTQDQICQMSEQAAGMAVATLQTLG